MFNLLSFTGNNRRHRFSQLFVRSSAIALRSTMAPVFWYGKRSCAECFQRHGRYPLLAICAATSAWNWRTRVRIHYFIQLDRRAVKNRAPHRRETRKETPDREEIPASMLRRSRSFSRQLTERFAMMEKQRMIASAPTAIACRIAIDKAANALFAQLRGSERRNRRRDK